MSVSQVVAADWTWLDRRFVRDVKIRVVAGRIVEIGQFDDSPTVRLDGHALLPGMVNVHSHAFQRGLRGKGESFPDGAGSFWSWREEMYKLVESTDSSGFSMLCEQAFREMLACGITTVGEFHYFHHADSSADFVFDKLILEAARRAGIRIVLLNAFYSTGGIGQPLTAGQRRFNTPSLDSYWAHMTELDATLDRDTQSLGVVAHSIRAVPIETVCALHEEATSRRLPFHMHVEEQRREIEECVHAYGERPMSLLRRETGINDNLTAVHCTHSTPEDIEEFFAAGGRACICPLTEANLGDGIPPRELIQRPGRLGLGTDSNARISMLEEMRWLEYGQRLSGETRGVIRSSDSNVATQLYEIATVHGAEALNADVGELRLGAYADFMAVDLTHTSLAFGDNETWLAALVFGAGNDAISDVCVGGRWKSVSDV